MSLVVANGAIYNRIVIPGKTRLLTPRRGTGQGGGGSGSAPFAFPSWGRGKRCGAGGRQPARALPPPLPRSARSRVRPSPSCLLQGRSPCPCLALLSPPGSLCWPRMPERLPVPIAEAGRRGSGGHGEGRDGLAGGFARRGSAGSFAVLAAWQRHASPAEPRHRLPPAPALLEPAFFCKRGFGTGSESQASPVSSPGLARRLQRAEVLPAGARGSPQPQLLPPSPSRLSLSPVSSALTKAAIWPGFFVDFSFISRTQETDPFPKANACPVCRLLPAHAVQPCPSSPGSRRVPAPQNQKMGRWGTSSPPAPAGSFQADPTGQHNVTGAF